MVLVFTAGGAKQYLLKVCFVPGLTKDTECLSNDTLVIRAGKGHKLVLGYPDHPSDWVKVPVFQGRQSIHNCLI